MGFIKQTLAMMWKEIQVAARDRGSLVILFILPAMLSTFFGGAPALTAQSESESGASFVLDVFVVNEDNGQFGNRLIEALTGLDMLNAKELVSEGAANNRILDGEATAAIIVPAGFSDDIAAYEQTEMKVIVDPTQQEGADAVVGIVESVAGEITIWGEVSHGVHAVFEESGALEGAPPEVIQAAEAQTTGVIMTQLAQARSQPGIAIRTENAAGVPTLTEFIGTMLAVIMPGFAVMFAFFLMPTIIVGSFFQETEDGSFRRLLAAPLPVGTILGGKMLAYLVVVFLQVMVLFTLGGVFGMPTPDSPAAAALVTVFLGLSVTALGMLVSVLSKTREQAESISNLLSFALAGISGCIPIGALYLVFREDSLMGTLARLTPHGHAMEGFYKAINESAGVADVLPQVGALALFAAVFYAIAIWRFRFE